MLSSLATLCHVCRWHSISLTLSASGGGGCWLGEGLSKECLCSSRHTIGLASVGFVAAFQATSLLGHTRHLVGSGLVQLQNSKHYKQ